MCHNQISKSQSCSFNISAINQSRWKEYKHTYKKKLSRVWFTTTNSELPTVCDNDYDKKDQSSSSVYVCCNYHGICSANPELYFLFFI
jgi:hypothetical protein